MILSKNVNNNKCAPELIFFNEKKIQKDSDDFWHRKLTLKVKFWYFLTAPHYSNFQNLVISFEYSWFLAKNLPNFVSLPWNLHNRECHSLHCARRLLWINTTLATLTREPCDEQCRYHFDRSSWEQIFFGHWKWL